MNTDEIAKSLVQSVKYYAGKGQYPDGSDEQKAYLDGVQTATAMMYVDLTGGTKTKGILHTLLTSEAQKREEVVRELRHKILSLKVNMPSEREYSTNPTSAYRTGFEEAVSLYRDRVKTLTNPTSREA